MEKKTFGDMIIGDIVGWDKRGRVNLVASSTLDDFRNDCIGASWSQDCGNDCRTDCPDCKDDKCSWDPHD